MLTLDLGDTRWATFVDACEASSPFHLPAWATLLADCYGYRAFALALAGTNGELIEGLPVLEVSLPLRPRRWISLPFTDYCPPLTRSGTVSRDLVFALEEEVRSEGVPTFELHAQLESDVFHHDSSSVRHTLSLSSGPDAVFRSFKKSQVQQPIGKALRSGVSVRRADGRADLVDSFYDLHLGTRRRLGVPVQPRRYFELLWERIIDPGLGFLLLAYAADRPVAGAVFLANNGTLVYKYSASDAKAWSLRANNLLIWKAIEWSAENGFDVFDFGLTDSRNEGLRAFKRGWGTEEEPLVYSTIGHRPGTSLSRWGAALSPLIRRSPRWVSRSLGEVFYKYAA